MSILIKHLLQGQAKQKPVVVHPKDSLETAIGLMLEHQYSQLPIEEEDGLPFGEPASFVTSDSIVEAAHKFGMSLKNLHVRDAAVTAKTVTPGEDLIFKMDDLLNASAVLVLDQGKIAGIVTHHDTTQFFRQRTEDLLLVNVVESTLKKHILAAYNWEDRDAEGPLQLAINGMGNQTDSLRKDCFKAFKKLVNEKKLNLKDSDFSDYLERPFLATRKARNFDDLTLQEYIQLASNKEVWDRMKLVIPKDAFFTMLEGARITRNKLMHFHQDISFTDRKRLRGCADWFQNHQPPSPPEPVGVQEPEVTASSDPKLSVIQKQNVTHKLLSSVKDAFSFVNNAIAPSGNVVASGSSKYRLLADFLRTRPIDSINYSCSFKDIEKIMQSELPASARSQRAWWANDSVGHVQSKEWLQAGWRVSAYDLASEQVTFSRANDDGQHYRAFFHRLVKLVAETASDLPLTRSEPKGRTSHPILNFPEGKVGMHVSFGKPHKLRVELYFKRGTAEQNLQLFRALLAHREAIEAELGQPLKWAELEGKHACRISLETQGSVKDSESELMALADWAAKQVRPMYTAFRPHLRNAFT